MTMIKYILPIILTMTIPAAATTLRTDHCINEAEFAVMSGAEGATLSERLQAPDRSIFAVYEHEGHYDVFRFVDGCLRDMYTELRASDIEAAKKRFDLERRAD